MERSSWRPARSAASLALSLAHDRKAAAEPGAAGPAVDLDQAAVVADDLRHQREAEPAAARLAADEGFEQMRADVFRDARPVVAHRHDERQVQALAAARDGEPHPVLV